MKPKPLKILLIASLVSLGIEGMADLAEAATMTTPIQTITLPQQAGDFSAIKPVNQFNPSLGTLLSVHISLSGTVRSQGSPEANNSINCVVGAGNCRGSVSGESTISVSLGSTLLAQVIPLTRQPFDLPEGQSTPVIPQQNQRNTGGFLTFTQPELLNQFIGTGQTDLLLEATAETILRSSGSTSAPLVISSSATGEVFYTYEVASPVEIPESSMLLGLGTISLLGFLTLKPKK